MDMDMKQVRESLDFIIEENRRKTFKKWIYSENQVCNADKMAEAGFIFIGNKEEPDAVRCFFCRKSLDGWEPSDQPWLEHLKHSPKCSFVKLQKPQSKFTVLQLLDIVNDLTESLIMSYYDKKAEEIKEKFEKYEEKIKTLMKQ